MKLKLKLLLLQFKRSIVQFSLIRQKLIKFKMQLFCRHHIAKMSAKHHWKCNRENKIKVVCDLCDKTFYKKGKDLLNYGKI